MMKNYSMVLLKSLFTIFLSGLSFLAAGQAFEGGPLLGISLNQIDGDRYSGYDMPGVIVGAYTKTTFGDPVNYQIEIKYFSKGASSGLIKDIIEVQYYRMRLRYIQVPVTGQISLNDRMLVEVGPSFGYLISAREDDGNGYVEPQKDFNTLEIAGMVGFNYMLGERIIANARFIYSLLPTREHPGNQTYYLDQGQYNNTISLSFYYLLF